MPYLITSQNNTTWRNIEWGPDILHSEENPNYHFLTYSSPKTATYLFPVHESILDPKLWTCIGEEISWQDGIRTKYAKVRTLEEFPIVFPTKEQIITFGILSAVNLVINPIFKEWAFNYLTGKDKTKETAFLIDEKLTAQLGTADHDYTSAAHPVLGSIMFDDPYLAANSAHRAYIDSLEAAQPVDLEKIAEICSLLSPEDIATLLE